MSVSSSSNSSLCHDRTHIFMFTAVFAACILIVLPLVILVLFVGYQQWRKQRISSTAATMSHSDIFTFHMVALEVIGFHGSSIYCYGIYTDQLSIIITGTGVFSIVATGQALFHILTCVERYLAVVHPVTYLRLRQAGGVRIRNISIGCVWLICFAETGLSKISHYHIFSYGFLLVLSSAVVAFCSICILRVLIRPGPGEVGGNRERIDQSKQRAFHTIIVIMGALLLKFLSTLVSTVIFMTTASSICDSFLIVWSAVWFSLPSSVVLPLLFLHRAGKLPGCAHNTASA